MRFYSNIFATGILPLVFIRSKVTAVPKPGKPIEDVASYRPKELLSTTYKLLEILIYNATTIDTIIPAEQEHFIPERSCADQVLALTSSPPLYNAGFKIN